MAFHFEFSRSRRRTPNIHHWLTIAPYTAKKRKNKVHTLDKVPTNERTSLQKSSRMARVVEGLHSFACTLTPGMNYITRTFAYPAEAGPH